MPNSKAIPQIREEKSGSQGAGRILHPCQERIPGQQEPRDPYPMNGIMGMAPLLLETVDSELGRLVGEVGELPGHRCRDKKVEFVTQVART